MTTIFEVLTKYQLHILVQLIPKVSSIIFSSSINFTDEKTEAQIV